MSIAVTGSSGFVGSHLLRRLAELGVDTIPLDLSEGMDVSDWRQFGKIGAFDTVVHLAARSFVADSYRYPRDFHYSNLVSTLNVLELCRIRRARMVFASSYVYGHPQYLPIDETHPTAGTNPYAQTKIIGEELCKGYHRDFGVPVVIVRPFNIYGQGQNSQFLVPLIINQAKTGRIVLRDPRPKRDFIHIDDVVELFVKATAYEQTSFETFNAGSGISYSVEQMVRVVKNLLARDLTIEFTDEQRKNEVMETRADVSKAMNLLNWEPKVCFREGLRRLLESHGIL